MRRQCVFFTVYSDRGHKWGTPVGERPARAHVDPLVRRQVRRQALPEAQREALRARPGHHYTIVGAQLRRWHHKLQACALRDRLCRQLCWVMHSTRRLFSWYLKACSTQGLLQLQIMHST